MFSPYSLDGRGFDKTIVQILRDLKKVKITTFSKEYKDKILAGLERIGEKALAERVRVIDGIETWEKILVTTRHAPRKRHEIMLVHDGYIVMISLEASPELYESADMQFAKIIESLKFFLNPFIETEK